MYSILTCIVTEHDLRLVVVAALVCSTACSAAFGFHLRSLKARSAMRWAWVALTGLVAGSGVWATHFIAMLAYQPSLPIGYEVTLTTASLVTAVIGMGAGFCLPVLQPGRAAALCGGALTGFSVAAMHFMGITAMRAQARIDWDERYVIASILVGAVGGAAAFYARTRLQRRAGWTVPALFLLLGIVGLHFTAMTAVRLVPDPTLDMPRELAGRGALALATVTLASLILAAASSLIWMERAGRRTTLSGVRDALDAVSSGLAFYDSAGRLLSWNRAYAALVAVCGVELAEGIARMALAEAALAAGWRPQGGDLAGRREAYVAGGSAPAMELLLPDGRWLRHEAFAAPDGGGVTVLTDITEQRETARILAEARDNAEAASRAKSQFLANMSHEIRTPLNGVLGVADVLAETDLSDQQQELVGVIRTSGALLNALLADLLDLARVEAGVAELRPEPTDLAAMVTSIRGLYAPRAEQKGLAIRAEIALGEETWASCDAMRLRQVIGNLVSNAVKFTDAGEVTIRVEREGEAVRFAVHDTGCGFDESLKATLFGRFQQADASSTREHGGAGLGLAICQEYLRLMGGALDCSSRPGAGSVFEFTLDLPALGAQRPLGSGEPGSAPVAPFRVLVVDDNAINRQVLGLILESAGIEHADAENGRVGVEAATVGGFHAILMDIQMPVMDGFEAIRRIRVWEAAGGRRRTPIYIVSANGLQEHVDAGMAAGADGHLMKPVSVAQLLGALEPHIALARAAA